MVVYRRASSYISDDGEVQEGTGDDKSKNTDGADVAGVPGKVPGGRFAHAHPLLDSGIVSQVSSHCCCICFC